MPRNFRRKKCDTSQNQPFLGWKVQPFVAAGPAIAFFLGARSASFIDGERISVSSANVNARAIDLGIGFGGGAAMALGPGHIQTEARYSLGLLSVDSQNDDEVTNRILTVLIGFQLPFGKEHRT